MAPTNRFSQRPQRRVWYCDAARFPIGREPSHGRSADHFDTSLFRKQLLRGPRSVQKQAVRAFPVRVRA
jgi:hypothetical protein